MASRSGDGDATSAFTLATHGVHVLWDVLCNAPLNGADRDQTLWNDGDGVKQSGCGGVDSLHAPHAFKLAEIATGDEIKVDGAPVGRRGVDLVHVHGETGAELKAENCLGAGLDDSDAARGVVGLLGHDEVGNVGGQVGVVGKQVPDSLQWGVYEVAGGD